MDVTQLPFNRLVGLEPAPPGSGFLVRLPDGKQYTNHLGTVHASALLAVAGAGSGAFLVAQLGNVADGFPVVRRLEAKFRRPASGHVPARAGVAPEEAARWASELVERGRVLAAVPVEVVDADGTIVLFATVEWLLPGESHRLVKDVDVKLNQKSAMSWQNSSGVAARSVSLPSQ